MNNYFLTREAKEDLWRIYEFGVYRFGETQAEKYLAMLYESFDKIAINPLMFPTVFIRTLNDIVFVVSTLFIIISKEIKLKSLQS